MTVQILYDYIGIWVTYFFLKHTTNLLIKEDFFVSPKIKSSLWRNIPKMMILGIFSYEIIITWIHDDHTWIPIHRNPYHNYDQMEIYEKKEFELIASI